MIRTDTKEQSIYLLRCGKTDYDFIGMSYRYRPAIPGVRHSGDQG